MKEKPVMIVVQEVLGFIIGVVMVVVTILLLFS
jgi:hypothetical protein